MLGLFVHDHKFPIFNNNYCNSYGFDEEFFKRYIDIFENLSIIGRQKELISDSHCKRVNSKIEFLTFKHFKELKIKSNRSKIDHKIKQSDFIIIRLPSILGLYAVQSAKKQNKPYIVEVVGCPWDAITNKGLINILPALIITYLNKKAIYSAKHVVYVTEKFLESRYPTSGKYIACSNVTLSSVNEEDLNKRLKSIEKLKCRKKVILGTCATIDVIYKGQQDVIAALARLKNEGYEIEYQLVGGGDASFLKSVAKKCGVENQVKFIGPLKHEDVFKWLDQIDIYVHPSKQEGLSRAIIEAMSKGCPIFGADAGGIHEQIDDEFIFDKGNIQQICDIYKRFTTETMVAQAIKNHNNSMRYIKSVLYQRREDFFKAYIKETKNQ